MSVVQIFPFTDKAALNLFDVRYHFRLNENHNSSSVSSSATIDIIDSNKLGPLSNPTNYSLTMPSDIATGSLLYNLDLIQTNIIGIQDSTQNKINDNKIYDLLGREVMEVQIGTMYIKNGKKYIRVE